MGFLPEDRGGGLQACLKASSLPEFLEVMLLFWSCFRCEAVDARFAVWGVLSSRPTPVLLPQRRAYSGRQRCLSLMGSP